MNRISVDLSLDPKDRWAVDAGCLNGVEELLSFYLEDMGMDDEYISSMEGRLTENIPSEYLDEIDGFSKKLGVSFPRVLVLNLYYDFIKMIIGCTAFSVPTTNGPLHARNLDWLSSNKALSRLTQITDFINGSKGPFTTIGWPGSIGTLSGVAKGRFSITLNAALSNDERVDGGTPIAFLIRDVLQNASGFDEAVDTLSSRKIPCDCLLLVSGVSNDESVVIERTPLRYAHRWAVGGVIIVTNDFIELDVSSGGVLSNELTDSSCGRFSRVQELISYNSPTCIEGCIEYLRDSKVFMDMTEQQMVFNSKNGRAYFESPK